MPKAATETPVMEKNLLLISEVAEDHSFATEVARAGGYQLLIAKNSAEACMQVGKFKDLTVFTDISTEVEFKAFDDNFRPLIGETAPLIHPNRVHLIGPEGVDSIRNLGRSGIFGHYIVRRYGNPQDAGAHYGKILRGLTTKQGLGLGDLISPIGSINIIKLGHSSEKIPALKKIHTFLTEETSYDERMSQVIVNAVDELLMNAIYDAPPDSSGEQKLKKVRRDTPLELTGNNSVELQMGFDGTYAAFTVIDRFGAINKLKLLTHLFESFSREKYQVNEGQAGAGVGLATTFRTGGSLVFLSEPGVRTEVTVFFKKTNSFKDFRTQFRFISVHVGAAEEK